MCVGKRELLIRELPDESRRLGQGIAIERLDREDCKYLDKAEELHGASLIVAPEEPTVALGDYEGGGGEARRIGKEPLEEGARASGEIQRGNRRGGSTWHSVF
jgi:hypothetical protein